MRVKNNNRMNICIRAAIYSFVLLFPLIGKSQQKLPTHKNFDKGLQKETRTTLGVPGAKYWQNTASYDINAEIIPGEKKLIGTESIHYQNNSPDSLKQLVFHIFQNLYKKGTIRDDVVHPDDVHNGVVIKELKINNQITPYRIEGTQLVADMKQPIASSSLVTIKVAWSFSIPSKSNIRMGAKDETSFFLGQWFPKVAVYDDLNGWDRNIHSGGQEFYYDLGNYNYTVTAPKGYLVWGTGMLQNPNEVLAKSIYKKYQKAKKRDAVVSIVTQNDYRSGKPITRNNKWIFEANHVSDVAFGVSDHFLWDGTSLKGVTEKDIYIEAVYPVASKDFIEVAELAKKSIHYFSTELPYPFPFPTMTLFNGTNGTSGMEYPMIANDPSADNRGRTVDVTAHEIAHNYFPFYVLTNETEQAWMDEAFAAMMPYKYQQKTEPTLNRLTRYARSMSKYANTDRNVASMVNSTMLRGGTSYFNLYMKPAVGLYVLQDILGEELFKKCLAAYIETWRGKHPTPLDFFYHVNQTSQQNLNWFWKPWFFENASPDLGIEKLEKITKDSYQITIKKTGELPVPLDLTVIYKDQTTQNIHYSAAVWKENDSKTIIVKTTKQIQKIVLGNDYIPDTNSKDNYWKN